MKKENMKESEKLMKEAITMKRIGIIGSILIPGPQWIPVITIAERKENIATMMQPEGLIGIMTGIAEGNPKLLEEFVGSFTEFAKCMMVKEEKEEETKVTEIK